MKPYTCFRKRTERRDPKNPNPNPNQNKQTHTKKSTTTTKRRNEGGKKKTKFLSMKDVILQVEKYCPMFGTLGEKDPQ